MANLMVNCSICLEILIRFPRLYLCHVLSKFNATILMQCLPTIMFFRMSWEIRMLHLPPLLSVLFFWLAMVLFLQSLHNSYEGTWCTL